MKPAIQKLVNAAKVILTCEPEDKYTARVRLQETIDDVTGATEKHIKNLMKRYDRPLAESTECICCLDLVERVQELEALDTVFEVWKGTQ